MFYNKQRITKAGLRELSLKTHRSEEKEFQNNKKKLIRLQKKVKLNDNLLVKFMKKFGIKNKKIYLDDNLKELPKQKIFNNIRENYKASRTQNSNAKSTKNILMPNETKLPDIKPNISEANKSKDIHPCLSSGNIITLNQESNHPVKANSTLNCNKYKNLYISPEEELAQLEKELELDKEAKRKKGYERMEKLYRYFSEGNEWEAINRYNKEIYDKEIMQEKLKKHEDKIKLKEGLDKQIKDKEKLDYIKSLEEIKFKQMMTEYNKKYEDEQQKEKKLKLNKIRINKKILDEQIKDRQILKKIEALKEQKFDLNTINVVKKELEKEKENLINKKKLESNMMKDFMRISELNIKHKLDQKKKEI